jgi:hypothetical protein
VILALAGLVHVPLLAALFASVIAELPLLSFPLTALDPGVSWDGWRVPDGLALG